MKKTIYALSVAVCTLFALVSCSKSDDNNGKKGGIVNNNFSTEVKSIASEEAIKKMADGVQLFTEVQILLKSNFLLVLYSIQESWYLVILPLEIKIP